MTARRAVLEKPEATTEVESVRARILRTARELFYREGVRAIGVDRIVAESGVAKTSLYRWFPSKDALITAFLEEEERISWQWWDANIERHKGSPREQLRAQIAGIAKNVAHPKFRGCPFDNVCTEFADEKHPARAVAHRVKEETRARLTALARDIGVSDPQTLGDQLTLLVEGAFGSGQVFRIDGPSTKLVAAADALVEAHLAASK